MKPRLLVACEKSREKYCAIAVKRLAQEVMAL